MPKLGFAGYVNHFNGGEILVNSLGNSESTDVADYWYNTLAAGMGYCFYSNDVFDHSAGIAIKYYDENDYGYRYSAIAFDAGYLLRIIKQFRCGIVFRNIGPDISYLVDDSTTIKFPLPYTIATGIGYSDSFNKGKLRILDIASEFSFRSVLGKYDDTYDFNSGAEIGLFKTFFFRFGYARDITIKGDFFSWGSGLSIFNHLEFDFFMTFYNDKYNTYDPSNGFSLSFKRGLNWSAKDWKWWLD
jgi:hypothetical protein